MDLLLTLGYFESQMTATGAYKEAPADLACYYKSPMMFLIAGKLELAQRSLNMIANEFLQPDGDFKTSHNIKSALPEYSLFWSYMNGWIVRAAQQLNRTDILKPAHQYLQRFYQSNTQDAVMSNVLTAAHHGLINLEAGNRDQAIQLGDFLIAALDRQPHLAQHFYLRFDLSQQPITQFPENHAPIYNISNSQSGQLYFMLGYPCAFLVILYRHTQRDCYLKAAQQYYDFLMTCRDVCVSSYSHKVAWAAALLLSVTQDKQYLSTIQTIAQYFSEQQHENGLWYADDLMKAYDQSAEIVCWFTEINRYIKQYENTLSEKV